MKYDFDEQILRRGTDSYKWDSAESENVLPMWVADMDFRTAPAIVDALRRRVEHGIFGYTRVPDSYYEAVTGWFARRHGWKIDRRWMIYTSGVVPAVSAIIKALTVPGDKVLVQTPVYNCFFSSIRNNGCEMISSPLRFAGNTYSIDYEDLERKAADPKVKVMLLCNPHNPAGRVWKREELVRIGTICIRHGVTVVSDEIHCELVFPGHRYIPFASISEDFQRHSVTCLSPSKAFNIAGLQIANIVCADDDRRAKIDRAINDNEVCDVNPFGVIATQAAYNEGEEWLNQLVEYLHANYLYMHEFCCKHLPDFPLTVLEGTYLVWMDCRKFGMPSAELERRLIAEAGLWLNAGTMYGAEGEGFMRWNMACPRAALTEGLTRFVGFVSSTADNPKSGLF
ncbi:MAG: pyridoxal phosphate-dependent aminotransferase [Odoribacter sp.]|nr:pyridoxal phosphate-dependent aminotransferase [Odoribacter sp.]